MKAYNFSKKIVLKTADGVNKSDYYSDCLLKDLIPFLRNKEKAKKINTVLEIGTGRGYISIVLAKEFSSVKKIIATDITNEAISIARQNILINNLSKIITIKKGPYFRPIGDEKFDLIIAVPPQLPLTKKEIEKFIPAVPAYHLSTSAGGRTGRRIIDQIIKNATKHLNNQGILCLAHADFSNFNKSLLILKQSGFKNSYILGKERKLLEETTLTRFAKKFIEKQNYQFKLNSLNKEFFEIGTIIGL